MTLDGRGMWREGHQEVVETGLGLGAPAKGTTRSESLSGCYQSCPMMSHKTDHLQTHRFSRHYSGLSLCSSLLYLRASHSRNHQIKRAMF